MLYFNVKARQIKEFNYILKMSFVYLSIAIICDVLGFVISKYLHNIEANFYFILVLRYGFVLLGNLFIVLSLKYLGANVVYAVWSGTGIMLIALIAMFFLNEQITFIKLIFTSFILIGIAGLVYNQ